MFKMNQEFYFGKRKISKKERTFIIAEISANHLQDYKIVEELVKRACEIGVDAIKLQAYTPDTITLNIEGMKKEIKEKYWIVNIDNPDWKGLTYYDLYKKAYMPWGWHEKLIKVAKNYEIPVFSTPFDSTAVDFLEKVGVSAYKVSSFDVINIPLLKKIALTKKPVIMSVGMANLDEIRLAYDTLKENGCPEIALLHCISSYPAKYEELNLSKIKDLEKKFNVVVGFSDHSLTTDAPAMAVALGARIIEKHITLDRKLGGPDSSFSLEPHEFKELVEKVREVEKQRTGRSLEELEIEYSNIRKAFGTVFYGPQSRIESQTSEARPSIWISENINKGEVFTEKNIKIARPGKGIPPKYFEQILGKKAKQNLDKGIPFSLDFIS